MSKDPSLQSLTSIPTPVKELSTKQSVLKTHDDEHISIKDESETSEDLSAREEEEA